jgi:GDP-L-fucose synthase
LKDKQIVVWGTGRPKREFLHFGDRAHTCVNLMKSYSDFEHVNVVSRERLTILELKQFVCAVVGSKLSITLMDGVAATYRIHFKHC